jgi:hypothetical protein
MLESWFYGGCAHGRVLFAASGYGQAVVPTGVFCFLVSGLW